jgi:hypothetical protein
MTWRSTFFKSLPKARFFPVIGFPHRKYVPPVAARRPKRGEATLKRIDGTSLWGDRALGVITGLVPVIHVLLYFL